MQDENMIVLIGNVGQVPEFKDENGFKIARFPLATTRKWKDKKTKEQKEKTTWHNIVAFSHSADYTKNYILKGAKCYVLGHQDNYTYTKKDGTTGYGSQVIAGKVSADNKEDAKKSNSNNQNNSNSPQMQDFPDMPDYSDMENS